VTARGAGCPASAFRRSYRAQGGHNTWRRRCRARARQRRYDWVAFQRWARVARQRPPANAAPSPSR
jgi:hypothetical protein